MGGSFGARWRMWSVAVSWWVLEARTGVSRSVGSGCAGLRDKMHVVCHAARMVSNSWKEAASRVSRVFSWTGDVGTESGSSSFYDNLLEMFGDWAALSDKDCEARGHVAAELKGSSEVPGGYCDPTAAADVRPRWCHRYPFGDVATRRFRARRWRHTAAVLQRQHRFGRGAVSAWFARPVIGGPPAMQRRSRRLMKSTAGRRFVWQGFLAQFTSARKASPSRCRTGPVLQSCWSMSRLLNSLPHEDPVGAYLFSGRVACGANSPVQVPCVRRPLEYSVSIFRWLGGNRKAVGVRLERWCWHVGRRSAGRSARSQRQECESGYVRRSHKVKTGLGISDHRRQGCRSVVANGGVGSALAAQTGPITKVHRDTTGRAFSSINTT